MKEQVSVVMRMTVTKILKMVLLLVEGLFVDSFGKDEQAINNPSRINADAKTDKNPMLKELISSSWLKKKALITYRNMEIPTMKHELPMVGSREWVLFPSSGSIFALMEWLEN